MAFFSLQTLIINAQVSGTYLLRNPNGSSCTITIELSESMIVADVWAWWGVQSARHGEIFGTGMVKNNAFELVLDSKMEDDGSCKPVITFSEKGLKAIFKGCEGLNVPEDFSGIYPKISTQTKGLFKVKAERCYFHQRKDPATQRKGFVIRGDELYVRSVEENDWAWAEYTNSKGNVTEGFVKLSALQKK